MPASASALPGTKAFAGFSLVVSSATKGQNDLRLFPVSAMSSYGGRATSSFLYDPNEEPLATELAQVAGNDPDLPLREKVGTKLFRLLYTDQVLALWHQTKARAEAESLEIGVRCRLSVDVAALSAIPWELLHDGNNFIATASDTPFSRYLPVGIAPYAFPTEHLRLLLIVQDPGGKFAITATEVESLERALKELQPFVVFKTLHNSPLAEIQAELQTGYHILHYLGHGDSERLFFASEQRCYLWMTVLLPNFSLAVAACD